MIRIAFIWMIAKIYGFVCGTEVVASLIKIATAPFPRLKSRLKIFVLRTIPEPNEKPIGSINTYINSEKLPEAVEEIYKELLILLNTEDQSL